MKIYRNMTNRELFLGKVDKIISEKFKEEEKAGVKLYNKYSRDFIVYFEKLQMAIVENCPSDIEFISNPMINICNYIINEHPHLCSKIQNPPSEIFEIIFSIDIESIFNIPNPTDDMIDIVKAERPDLAVYFDSKYFSDDYCESMLDDFGKYITHMSKITEEHVIRAFKTYPHAIMYIENPSIDIVAKALDSDPFLIDYINLTEENTWFILKNYDNLLLELYDSINYTDEQLEYILENNPQLFITTNKIPDYICYEIIERYSDMALYYISCPSDEIIEAAVAHSPENYRFLVDKESKFFLDHFIRDPFIIKYISNPPDIFCFLAVILNPDTINYINRREDKILYLLNQVIEGKKIKNNNYETALLLLPKC